MILEDIYKVLDLHFNRAEQAIAEIRRIQLCTGIFNNFESVKTIDTFIYRFSKIQDYNSGADFELIKKRPSSTTREIYRGRKNVFRRVGSNARNRKYAGNQENSYTRRACIN